MGRQKRPKQFPEGANEAMDPKPDVEPDITEELKGDPSSRLDSYKEPFESEEKRRVAGRLEERSSWRLGVPP